MTCVALPRYLGGKWAVMRPAEGRRSSDTPTDRIEYLVDDPVWRKCPLVIGWMQSAREMKRKRRRRRRKKKRRGGKRVGMSRSGRRCKAATSMQCRYQVTWPVARGG